MRAFLIFDDAVKALKEQVEDYGGNTHWLHVCEGLAKANSLTDGGELHGMKVRISPDIPEGQCFITA